jgi:transposase
VSDVTTEKKQKRQRRSFTDEFKAEAVKLVLNEGKTVAQAAKDLDLTPSSLGHWVEQARADRGKSTRGTLTTEEKEELARLRKENRELRLEREILKKAAAFFAKENA